MGTHEVLNQPPPLVYDASDDVTLLEGLRREQAIWAEREVREIGVLAGSEQCQDWGRLANAHPPVLRTHDRFGHRIDEVEVPHAMPPTSVNTVDQVRHPAHRLDAAGDAAIRLAEQDALRSGGKRMHSRGARFVDRVRRGADGDSATMRHLARRV